MARRKRLTPNQKKFNEQLDIINQHIQNLASYGYILPPDFNIELPKRVTKKELEKLYKMNRAYLREISEWVDLETGEITPPPKIEYTPASTVQFNTTIIENFKSEVLGYPKHIAEKIINFINRLVEDQGTDAVSRMLSDNSYVLEDYLNTKKYDSAGAVEEFCSDLLNYLPDATEGYKEELMEDIFYETYNL